MFKIPLQIFNNVEVREQWESFENSFEICKVLFYQIPMAFLAKWHNLAFICPSKKSFISRHCFTLFTRGLL